MKSIYTVVLFAVLTIGCAGTRNSVLDTSQPGKIYHTGQNISLLDPDEGAVQLARAYEITERAKMYSRMMDGTASGTGDSGISTSNYVIGIVNNDPKKCAYLFHPEIPGMRIDLDPNGGSNFIPVISLPAEIVIYNSRGGVVKKIRPIDDLARDNRRNGAGYKKMFAGHLVDLRYKIDKIN